MTPFRNNTRRAAIAVCALGLTATASAQVWNMGDGMSPTTNNRRFHRLSGNTNMVRYGNQLFSAVVRQDGAVLIRRKVDNVTIPPQWTTLVTVNSNTTGIGSLPTNNVALAGTDKCLHVTWARYYAGSCRQYYRALTYTGTFESAIQNVTTYAGVTATTLNDSLAIAVGGRGQVYMTAPTTTAGRAQLLQSDWAYCPPAAQYANPQWLLRGDISGNSASAANVRIIVDQTDLVTLAFYNNSLNGRWATRCFFPTPPATGTWYPMEIVTTGPHFQDGDGCLATDSDGYVHMLYRHRLGGLPSATRQLIYHRRAAGATSGWGAGNIVYGVTGATVGANSVRGSFTLTAGRRLGAFAVFRDFECGRLVVRRKLTIEPIAAEFRFVGELDRSTVPNDLSRPTARATLNIAQNRMRAFLDITYTRPAGGGYYAMFHNRLHVGAFTLGGNGCAGSCGVPATGHSGVVLSSQPHTLRIDLERARPFGPSPNGIAVLLFEVTASPLPPTGTPFFGCTLYTPLSLWDVQLVDPCCTARSVFPKPPGGFPGLYMTYQWFIFDASSSSGFSMSNWSKVRL